MRPLVLVSLALAFVFANVRSATAEPKINTNGTAYAIGGYDVVAYFSAHAPMKGKQEFATQYQGATWLFSSADHKAQFEKSPDSYAPAFHGYCAYGVANDHLVSVDPNAWNIYQGRLYLNYSLEIRTKWLEDRDGFIAKAKAKWPGLGR